eukprot:9322573-Pyramimonas_sp.AAC.1
MLTPLPSASPPLPSTFDPLPSAAALPVLRLSAVAGVARAAERVRGVHRGAQDGGAGGARRAVRPARAGRHQPRADPRE